MSHCMSNKSTSCMHPHNSCRAHQNRWEKSLLSLFVCVLRSRFAFPYVTAHAGVNFASLDVEASGFRLRWTQTETMQMVCLVSCVVKLQGIITLWVAMTTGLLQAEHTISHLLLQMTVTKHDSPKGWHSAACKACIRSHDSPCGS